MNRSGEKMPLKSGYLAVEQMLEDTDEWARRRAVNKKKKRKGQKPERERKILSSDEQTR